MNATTLRNAQPIYTKQRRTFRLSMLATDPVYLLFAINGISIDPSIDELSAGGARLVCCKQFDQFQEGQILGPAILVLREAGTLTVFPVVRWMEWPSIGVEFLDIREREQERIYRFLFQIERKIVEPNIRPSRQRSQLSPNNYIN